MEKFLQNKYTKWYFSIINNAKTRPDKIQGERHHIIPKSMGGSETVLLSYKEHFICHCLLVRMLPKNSIEYSKMVCALSYMGSKSRYHGKRYVSKLYEMHRKKFKKAQRRLLKGKQAGKKNSQYGKPRSEATKLKISNALKLRHNTEAKKRFCVECGKQLNRRNKGDYCNRHRLRTISPEGMEKLRQGRKKYLDSLSVEKKRAWAIAVNIKKYGSVSVDSPKIE